MRNILCSIVKKRSGVMNGQAENWKECSLLYDQQLHQWTPEQNSAEALEFQKQAA